MHAQSYHVIGRIALYYLTNLFTMTAVDNSKWSPAVTYYGYSKQLRVRGVRKGSTLYIERSYASLETGLRRSGRKWTEKNTVTRFFNATTLLFGLWQTICVSKKDWWIFFFCTQQSNRHEFSIFSDPNSFYFLSAISQLPSNRISR